MQGKKFDNKKPDILKLFSNVPLSKKDFPKEKKSDLKIDFSNINYTLLPFKAIQEIAKGLMFGAKQYGNDNWKLVKPFKKRYGNALLRHLYQYFILKEKIDKKTGLSHLALAGCSLLFLLEKELMK